MTIYMMSCFFILLFFTNTFNIVFTCRTCLWFLDAAKPLVLTFFAFLFCHVYIIIIIK